MKVNSKPAAYWTGWDAHHDGLARPADPAAAKGWDHRKAWRDAEDADERKAQALAAAKARLVAKFARQDRTDLRAFFKSDRYRRSGAPGL